MSKQKPTKDKSGRSRGDEGENMRSKLKRRKEPNQMESMANTATVWNGCSSQGRLRCLGQKKKNIWQRGARLCVCAVVWEAGSDIQFQNLHVKAHWGFKVISFSSIPINFHRILNLISFYSYLLFYGKKLLFTNRIVLFFLNCFFFWENKKCFFFSICSVKSLSR